MKRKAGVLLAVLMAVLLAFSPVSSAFADTNVGWQNSGGGWWYACGDGSYARDCWLQDGGNWYHFDGSGWMQTGWISSGGNWYYLLPSGEMAVGWLQLGDSWYYLSSSGEMAVGWLQTGDAWYYLSPSGEMAVGWLQLGECWYYLSPSGEMAAGWLPLEEEWYYLEPTGERVSGWKEIAGTWYYFFDSGVMAAGTQVIEDAVHVFSSDGAWESYGSGWVELEDEKVYAGEDGVLLSGLQEFDGKSYWFDASGVMQRGCWVRDGEKVYYADATGVLLSGWQEIEGAVYCFDASGTLLTGLQEIDGKTYWFDASGVKQRGWVHDGENLYYLSPSGELVNSWKIDGSSGWELSQYPDATGNQAMFYSLYDRTTGDLILIDGGWTGNAEQVRSVIDSLGGKVKAWFLTHYHGDHIGAFNTVYGEYKDRIDTVYVNPLDWETFEPIYKSWDMPEAFAAFLEATEGAENVVTLYAGDELEIDDLDIFVFSSFDEHVKELSTDWPNDSSIVFKISAGEDSVLFLGDLSAGGVKLGQYILDTYGAEEVSADYVQAGHHGNWGQPVSFYEQLKPKVIFQDGPEWLFGDGYDAKDLKSWCEENGIQAFDYRNAPHSFVLR